MQVGICIEWTFFSPLKMRVKNELAIGAVCSNPGISLADQTSYVKLNRRLVKIARFPGANG